MRHAHRPAARESLQRLSRKPRRGKSHMRVRRTRANSAHSPRYASPRRARESLQRHSRKPRPFPRIERRVVKGQLERRRERRIAQQRAVIAIFIVCPRPLRQRVGQQAVKPVPNTNIDISVISTIVFRARAAFGARRIPPQIPHSLRFMAFSSVSCAVHFYFTISFQCCQQAPPARKPAAHRQISFSPVITARKPAKPHPHSSAPPKSAIAFPPTSFHAKATRPPKSAIPSPPKPAS